MSETLLTLVLLLPPVVICFIVGNRHGARRSVRWRWIGLAAFGLSLLLTPIALGALADEVGLGHAHLALPALILAAYASFFIGEALQRKAERAIA